MKPINYIIFGLVFLTLVSSVSALNLAWSDDFNRASIGGNWTLDGTDAWSISSGQLLASGADVGFTSRIHNLSNYTTQTIISATVSYTGNRYGSVSIHNGTSCIASFYYDLASVYLNCDASIDLGTGEMTTSTPYVLNFSINGNNLSYFKDNVYKNSITIGNKPDSIHVVRGNTMTGYCDNVSQYTDLSAPANAITLINSYNNSAINSFTARFANVDTTEAIQNATVASYPLFLNKIKDNIGDFNGVNYIAKYNSSHSGFDFYGENYSRIETNIYVNSSLGKSFWIAWKEVRYNTTRISNNGFSFMANNGGAARFYFRETGVDSTSCSLGVFSYNPTITNCIDFNKNVSYLLVYYGGNNSAEIFKNADIVSSGTSITRVNDSNNIKIGSFSQTSKALNGTIIYMYFGHDIPSNFNSKSFALWLNNSPVIAAKTITTTNGTIYYPDAFINETMNITLSNISGVEGQFFNVSINNSILNTSILTNTSQAILYVYAKEKITNTSLKFNVTVNGSYPQFASSQPVTYEAIQYLDANTYQLNGIAANYQYNATTLKTISPLTTDSATLWFASNRLNITLNNSYNHSQINAFNVTVNYNNSYYIEELSTTTGSVLFYGIDGTYNITIHDIEANSYFNVTVNDWNILSDWLNATTNQANLTLTARDSNNNTISNFTCSNTYLDNTTSTGTISLLVNQIITLNCGSGSYINTTEAITSNLLSLNNYQIVFRNTSMTFVFRNEKDNTLYNLTKVDLELISVALNLTYNHSTINGSISLPSVENSYYHVLFDSNVSNKRATKFYIPPDVTTFSKTLYILDTEFANTISFIIQDENGNRIEGAVINIYKWFSNSNYVLVGAYETNYNGLVGIDLQDLTLYKYEIYYNNQLKESTSEFFFYAVSGNTKTFTISLTDDTITDIINIANIDYNLTFNNNTKTVNVVWSDTSGIAIGAYVEIYNQNNTLYHTISGSGSSGTLSYVMPATSGLFYVLGYINQSSTQITQVKNDFIDLNPKLYSKNMLFIIFIWIFIIFMLFIFVDWRIALIAAIPFSMDMFRRIGLLPIPGYIPVFFVIVILIIIGITELRGRL